MFYRMLKKEMTKLLIKCYVYITSLSGDNVCDMSIHCQAILKFYKSFDFQRQFWIMPYTHVGYYTISERQIRKAGNETSSSKAVLLNIFFPQTEVLREIQLLFWIW
jgi:hypothetical protein